MAAMSRNKGKVGEREIAALIADETGWHVRRRVRQHEGDSDLEGVPGWCVEVKRHATASAGELAAWWAQAVAQAERAGELPLLLYRTDRAAWRAVWPLSVTLTQHHPDYWRGFEWTVNTSIEAWAAVARETAAGDRGVKEGQAEVKETVNPSAPPACDARALFHMKRNERTLMPQAGDERRQ